MCVYKYVYTCVGSIHFLEFHFLYKINLMVFFEMCQSLIYEIRYQALKHSCSDYLTETAKNKYIYLLLFNDDHFSKAIMMIGTA